MEENVAKAHPSDATNVPYTGAGPILHNKLEHASYVCWARRTPSTQQCGLGPPLPRRTLSLSKAVRVPGTQSFLQVSGVQPSFEEPVGIADEIENHAVREKAHPVPLTDQTVPLSGVTERPNAPATVRKSSQSPRQNPKISTSKSRKP